MNQRFFFIAIIFLFFAFLTPSPVQSAEQSKAEQYRQQTILEFKEWRKDIPDYEKRLYDRVKKVNSRTVRLYNLVLGGFVVLLILNLFLLDLVVRSRRRQAGADIGQNAPQEKPLGREPLEDSVQKKTVTPEKREPAVPLGKKIQSLLTKTRSIAVPIAKKVTSLSRKIGITTTFSILGLVVFLGLLKGYDIYIYESRSTPGAVSDNERDEFTGRTFDYSPFTTMHVQPFHRTKGWNGVGSFDNRDEAYNFTSGDHGFFVDIDIDNPPAKEADEFRIILTGGSGAQGWGGTSNDLMFYRQLEKTLGRALAEQGVRKKIRVINLAMGGTVSYHNYIALNKWGHKLEPDLILSFSGHNELVVPKLTGDDAGYTGSGYGALNMILKYPHSPAWLKALAKIFPGFVHRTGFGTAVRSFYYSNFSAQWRDRYWLDRYDPEYRGGLDKYEARARYGKLRGKFDVHNKLIVPWYVHAIESMHRDFPKIPMVLAFQPLHETADIYDRLRNDMRAVFSGRTEENLYWTDVHKYWEDNDYFKGSLVDSVHLANKGHTLVAEFLAKQLLPIVLKTKAAQ